MGAPLQTPAITPITTPLESIPVAGEGERIIHYVCCDTSQDDNTALCGLDVSHLNVTPDDDPDPVCMLCRQAEGEHYCPNKGRCDAC